MSGISKSLGVALSLTEVLAQAIVPFMSPPLTEIAGRCHTQGFHQHGYHCVPCPADSLKPCPTKLAGPPICF